MKENKKNIKRYFEKNQSVQSVKLESIGFTIIETLFSLLLVALAILLISKTMVSAIDTNKKSNLRFNMQQTIECRKNQLLSKPFEDPQLKEGTYKQNDRYFRINWNISDISPTLKFIDLSVSFKTLTKRIQFYKSKEIKNISPIYQEVENA